MEFFSIHRAPNVFLNWQQARERKYFAAEECIAEDENVEDEHRNEVDEPAAL